MKMSEYEKVKNLTYLEYCTYLQQKYGIGRSDYMYKSYNRNHHISRTKEGLVVHHKFEDHAIMLCNPIWASRNPFEWQLAKNMVYCDYLEHLFLHLLIVEHPAPDKNPLEAVGIGGICNFIVPELNDVYSGFETKQPWRRTCHALILPDKNVYFALLKRIKKSCDGTPCYQEELLYRSYNAPFHLWDTEKNQKIFQDIRAL